MTFNLLDRIGNWNPQLFREIKGRLKIGNIAIASALSLCGQLLLFLFVRAQMPVAPPAGEYTYSIYSRFCTEFHGYNDFKCVRDALGNFAINWQYLLLNLFVFLSIFSAIVLLVAGTYMLVSDLDKEERRGTLNYIRLSPQSANTIFIGKIFGVPILLYLAAILAVPLHLYSGLAAKVPLQGILCFYIAIVASCALFYSAAMLFGLTTSWLGGFQPWLASAAVLFFITVAFNMPLRHNPAVELITFLSPAAVLKLSVILVIDTISGTSLGYALDWLTGFFYEVQWFSLPVGTKLALTTALNFSICATGTYWLWKGWQRRFPNPNATVLSKGQSYLLVICCQIIILGFAFQDEASFNDSISGLLIFNLLMFIALIAALTPDRQSLYDWARYRQQIVPRGQKLWRRYPLLDLIWSEKSPAVVAIAINLFISVIIFIPWMLFQGTEKEIFCRVILCVNLILIYASIAQLFLLTKKRNLEIWAAGTIGSSILLPHLILYMLSIDPATAPILWLSSTFPILWLSSTFASFWFSLSFTASGNTILFAILSQWTVLVLLNLKLRSQLKIAGQSASKALLKA
ncbi:MAG: hypothetical protein MUE44_36415 [Oscillatoriaceae cyanobacterium Prado104]|jgi:hypothetical protein|nr:hypothetical protein [Oscillatoriaceae cyanobacterium Prado104]